MAAPAAAAVHPDRVLTLRPTHSTLPLRVCQLHRAEAVVPVLALQPHHALRLRTHTALVVLHWLALLPIGTLNRYGAVDRFCEGMLIYVNTLVPNDRSTNISFFLLNMLNVIRWKHREGQLLHFSSQPVHFFLHRSKSWLSPAPTNANAKIERMTMVTKLEILLRWSSHYCREEYCGGNKPRQHFAEQYSQIVLFLD